MPGLLIPASDGKVNVTVQVGNREAVVAVESVGHAQPDPTSFRYDAIPALTRQGCNSGACHGSPSGKGGFSLSMLGYDPEMDLLSLVRGDGNRRTNVLEPERSLLLRKPTMQTAHGGGQKLLRTDPAYTALRQWIAEGCKADLPTAPRLTRVEVYPGSGLVVRRPASTQQLLVLAHFSDGPVAAT